MLIQNALQDKLFKAFKPVILKIVNDSPNHKTSSSESHFSVLIVSKDFFDLNLIQRHQMVHQAIKKELQDIHAFSQTTLTPQEYTQKGGKLPDTPACAKSSS